MRRIIELIKQNRFYSLMMIVSATITITYVMAAFIVCYMSIGNFAPEVNRSRSYMLTSIYGEPKNREASDNTTYGIGRLNRDAINIICSDIPSIEFYSISNTAGAFMRQRFIDNRGKSVNINANKSDANIWKIFDYTFLEGAPFTTDDVESENRVAVLSELGAYRLLGQSEGVVGQYVEIDGEREKYKVVGIIENSSRILQNAFAEVIIPIRGDSRFEHPAKGNFSAYITLKKGYNKKDLIEDMTESMQRYNATYLSDEDLQILTSDLDRTVIPLGADVDTYYVMIFLFGVLILIPSINGLSLSATYISKRTSEIAIRKAYGAKPRQIVWEFVFENFMITSVGALLGLIASYPFSEMIISMITIDNGEAIYETVATLPQGVAFDYRIYLAAVLFNLIFNFLAIYSPARKAVKRSIASTIKGDI